MKQVWVEIQNSKFVRIFKSKSRAIASKSDEIIQVEYAHAIERIRHHLFVRSGGYCELCGDLVIESSGHMHEMKHRGNGGEISMDNSVFVCPKTHKLEHKARNIRFTKKNLDI